jgi:hypothetical protein
MPEERWRAILGFPLYEVSDLGRVRSLSRTTPRGNNYIRWRGRVVDGWQRFSANGKPVKMMVALRRDGAQFNVSVHRLVLTAFVGLCPPGLEGCHEDGYPFNNILSNLRWDTRKANQADSKRHGTKSAPPIHRGESHHCATLSDDEVAMIRSITMVRGTRVDLSRRFGVSSNTIYRILAGISR